MGLLEDSTLCDPLDYEYIHIAFLSSSIKLHSSSILYSLENHAIFTKLKYVKIWLA